MRTVLVSIVLSAVSSVSFAGSADHGGDLSNKRKASAWFVERTPPKDTVRACIQRASDYELTFADLKTVVLDAYRFWLS